MHRKKLHRILTFVMVSSMLMGVSGCRSTYTPPTVMEEADSSTQSIPPVSTNTLSSNAMTAYDEEPKEADSAAESLPEQTESQSASEESAPEADLATLVKGLTNFSIIEGRSPDLTAGIRYDETLIRDVTPDDSQADWLTPGTYPIVYTITGVDGRTQTVTVQAEVVSDLEQYMYGMEGYAIVEIGGTFDAMANVETDEEIASIVADTSELNTSKEGDYLISYLLTGTNGKTQTAVRQVSVMTAAEKYAIENGMTITDVDGSSVTTEDVEYSTVTDLGLWRLTAYMDTPEDQGQYVGQTASGAPLVAGRTVAVSSATCARLGLNFGDKLMIDGHIYVLEDHGGSAMHDQLWVDIFVDNVEDEYSEKYNKYTQVYLLR